MTYQQIMAAARLRTELRQYQAILDENRTLGPFYPSDGVIALVTKQADEQEQRVTAALHILETALDERPG